MLVCVCTSFLLVVGLSLSLFCLFLCASSLNVRAHLLWFFFFGWTIQFRTPSCFRFLHCWHIFSHCFSVDCLCGWNQQQQQQKHAYTYLNTQKREKTNRRPYSFRTRAYGGSFWWVCKNSVLYCMWRLILFVCQYERRQAEEDTIEKRTSIQPPQQQRHTI